MEAGDAPRDVTVTPTHARSDRTLARQSLDQHIGTAALTGASFMSRHPGEASPARPCAAVRVPASAPYAIC